MSEHHFDEEEELHLLEQRAREAKREKRTRRPESAGGLSMNSLMDIMTIILVFLLKNYGDEPIKVIGEDLKVPMSTTELTPEDMTTITISTKAILVNNAKAVDVKSGSVDKSQKKGGEASLNIQPLFDELTEAIKRKKRESKLLGQTYEPIATIIADQGTPYRLLTEVMYTAGQAELSQFKFAVVRGERKTFAAE
jgi:biopolymer transport protein ExbD